FISTADDIFGPITTIRRGGRTTRHIPWTAFRLDETDWDQVRDTMEILKASRPNSQFISSNSLRTQDANDIQQHFSAEKQPTLWRALPAIEELQTAWETKLALPRFAIYEDAIQDGLDKLKKYYSRFNEKPAYILSLALHPYYKLAYIKLAWGGPDEQEAEREAGNPDTKDWQDEARKVLETTVRFLFNINTTYLNIYL
ncbi:hypothetical protein BD779DRAFT_1459077, partial [Infundibulicybe gibba]